jgi:hypothetical protein
LALTQINLRWVTNEMALLLSQSLIKHLFGFLRDRLRGDARLAHLYQRS